MRKKLHDLFSEWGFKQEFTDKVMEIIREELYLLGADTSVSPDGEINGITVEF